MNLLRLELVLMGNWVAVDEALAVVVAEYGEMAPCVIKNSVFIFIITLIIQVYHYLPVWAVGQMAQMANLAFHSCTLCREAGTGFGCLQHQRTRTLHRRVNTENERYIK